jgi:hypothetical protein
MASTELREIRSGGHLPKTLLVVPPALTRFPAEVGLRAATAGVGLASTAEALAAGGRMVIACWRDAHGMTRVICSTRVSEIDYELALRLFLAYGNLTWPRREVQRSRR